MQRHASYTVLEKHLQQYPRTAGSLLQTYNDLTLSQKWTEVRVIELHDCGRAAIEGYRPIAITSNQSTSTPEEADEGKEEDEKDIVVACSLAETLSAGWISKIFVSLPTIETFYLAICSEDSSTVYYKISKGMVKPPL
jgi:tRNA-splicing endonuclease subunit Sen15